ncbi:uncharacterized protein LOC116342784 isoform X2 [Contarinia nasturtii]|uniref:uncharacterized protein LOC116342784 isoform X2 n=1 Tax=Contarinia nasturtii TaxID=265458 RepID=UPI0012D3BF52|nr:uncharacterized protein LOC116342784 isoform X2 [Contarinia nasturtii]
MAEENPTEKHCELCNVAIILLLPVSTEWKLFIREKITKDYDINKICANCWKGVTSFQNDIRFANLANYAMKNERNLSDVCNLCCSPVLSNEPVSSFQLSFLSDTYGINLESTDKICTNCKDSLAKYMEQVDWWNAMMGGFKKAPTLEKISLVSMTEKLSI